MALYQHTIAQHIQALKQGDYSSVELTEHFLERIRQYDALNAFINVTETEALEQAHKADKKIKQGDAHPLTGIPIAHKDIFCTDGILTTCASKMLANFKSPYDAEVVSKTHEADMPMLGKTNLDEFAMGSSNENSAFGVVQNPWRTTHVPGGSSGGSAAAVAAGLCPVATGTDTGGSIRQPAAFCGLSGIKPSYGRVSRHGMIAFASSLDQGGIMSKGIEDAAYVLQQISGFDPKDSTSLNLEVPDYLAQMQQSIKGKVIGIPRGFFAEGLNPEIAEAIQQSLDVLRALGAKTVDIELKNSALGIPCYYVLAPAEASSNLSRYDGVRFGFRAEEYQDLNDMYEETRAQGFGEEVKRRIMIGTYVLSSGYYDAYYIKAQKMRRLIAEDFNNAFTQCDFIVGPTTPTTAFAIGSETDDPVTMYLNDIYTVPANLAGLPGLSIPCGFDQHGLPIGLQMIGQYLDEGSILQAAYQFQQQTDWHTKWPTEVQS